MERKITPGISTDIFSIITYNTSGVASKDTIAFIFNNPPMYNVHCYEDTYYYSVCNVCMYVCMYVCM